MSLELVEFEKAGRSPQLPTDLQLPDGELVLRRWLRVLPNRRYVGVAEWQGRRVLAKLLVGRRAERHFRRERDGTALLTAQGLPTPQLLAAGYLGGAGGWLLFDFLENAESLGGRLHAASNQPTLSVEQRALLAPALAALGAMHARGLWQDDLHLDNLLWHDGRLFWVDGGSVRACYPGRPLPANRVLANLSLFWAQLPAEYDSALGELLDCYRNGNPGADLSLPVLQAQVRRIRRWRLGNFLGKVSRDCSLFQATRGAGGLTVVNRDETGALQPLLADPERFLLSGRVLKSGRSATVVRVVLGGRELVVKRCNIKGFRHWLRRCWRPSRAWHAWREGHRLAFLGIATAKPLAVIEKRNFWLRGRAYLMTEFLGGDNILSRFAPYVGSVPPAMELAALDNLFSALMRERISHGDLKGSNLIWCDGRWALIDLDAMRQHCSRYSFARAYARDRARFLRNWPEDSPLCRLLDERLPQVP